MVDTTRPRPFCRRHGAFDLHTAAHAPRIAEGAERIQLREEELQVHKQLVETGKVRVRKEVVTEHRTIEVPVQREEIVIERHAPNSAPVPDSDIGPGEEIHIPVKGAGLRGEAAGSQGGGDGRQAGGSGHRACRRRGAKGRGASSAWRVKGTAMCTSPPRRAPPRHRAGRPPGGHGCHGPRTGEGARIQLRDEGAPGPQAARGKKVRGEVSTGLPQVASPKTSVIY